ncbi:homeobox protein knotted-1-like 2 isoform X1 [Zingiber officinale]|uniref:homeobox protein knotted-1-like 2 isoform X1 n=1 Tax=Zingiber officinale TaxID=94328 RepID=UPI001C4BCB10|nr:homeobox protein knotted-1-like 2 isoform X1 [Zingiber officinale]
MMSFHKQLQRELTTLPYVAEQQQLGGGDGSGVLRTEMNHFSASDEYGEKDLHRLVKGGANGPRWLNSGILRPQPGEEPFGDGRFLHLQTASEPSASAGHWFPRPPILHRGGDGSDDEVPASSSDAVGISGACGEPTEAASGEGTWQDARHKAEILAHPLYEQLLTAHVACLRIATPVDQLPRIDAQLAQSQQVVSKYSVLANGGHMLGDDKELDQFMTHYALLLCSFKEQLQQHVRVHAMEAVMACWELEQALQSFTAGVSAGEGTGATMSDDDDDDDNQVDSETNLFAGSFDGPDSMGFGPLVPTESERGLMERVRQELKLELKQGYKEKIIDIREEILRKRRAGKLPGDSTSTLKAWWQSHSKWPYPTEDDKARLVQETGLQLKQINNWFINQRKRNWHTNPSSSTSLKTKRKR